MTSDAIPAKQWQREELDLLQVITQEILSTLDLQELLWKVVREVCERLELDFVSVALLREGRELAFRAAHGRNRNEDEGEFLRWGSDVVIPIDHGIVGRAARMRQTQVVGDVLLDADYVEVEFLSSTRSELAVPVLRGDRVIGVLDVQSNAKDGFSEPLVRQVERLAPLVGVAIENARALAHLEARNRQLQLSEAVSRIAVGATDVEDLASRVSVKLREALAVDYVGLSRLRQQAGYLELVGSAAEPGLLSDVPRNVALGEGLSGRAVRCACSLVFDAGVEPTRADALGSWSRSEIAVPLSMGGKPVGLIHLASREPERFGPEDAQLLEAVAGPVSHALANAVAMDKLEDLRAELSGMIVHDLRNPLMVVLTALRVLERIPEVQQDARCQRYLRNAGVAGDELLRLIGSLLDLHKLESGELSLQRTTFSLGDVVTRVVANNRILAEVEEVSLHQELDSDVSPVRADLDLVLRTVENLVGNALKFTPAGGTVRVGVRRASQEELATRQVMSSSGVLLEVVDSGEGIPLEEQERIFEKFGVVKSRKHRVKVSTGLGLALCKRVVTAHGGRIWVDSDPGAGARFAFILPAG